MKGRVKFIFFIILLPSQKNTVADDSHEKLANLDENYHLISYSNSAVTRSNMITYLKICVLQSCLALLR